MQKFTVLDGLVVPLDRDVQLDLVSGNRDVRKLDERSPLRRLQELECIQVP